MNYPVNSKVKITGGPYAGTVGRVRASEHQNFVKIEAESGERRTVHRQLVELIETPPVVPTPPKTEPEPRLVHTSAPDLENDVIDVFEDGSWSMRQADGKYERDAGGSIEDDLEVPCDYPNEIHRSDEGDCVFYFETAEQCAAVWANLLDAVGRKPESGQPDLKPRGAKRQWWLMPLDALAYVMDTCDGEELRMVAELARYQRNPNAVGAARCAGAFLVALQAEHDLTFEQALDSVLQVFEHGAAKYNPDNWRNAIGTAPVELFGVEYSPQDAFRNEYLSGQCRHTFPTNGPIDLDHTLPDGTEVKGSDLPHLAHAACGALMVTWHELYTFA